MRNLNIPNILTSSRILASPIIVWMAWSEQSRITIFLLVVLLSATDAMDGWIARTFGQVTKLGAQLDPLADKIYPMCIVGTFFIIHGITPYTIFFYGLPTLVVLRYSVIVTVMRWRGDIVQTIQDAKVKQFFIYVTIVFLTGGASFETPLISWTFEVLGVISGWHAAFLTQVALDGYRTHAIQNYYKARPT